MKESHGFHQGLDPVEGQLLASAETEQVVLRADGELLLTLPAGLKRLTEEILAFQDSAASL